MNTDFQGIRVLVLEGYARQSLALVKAFHRLGCHVSALCSSKLDVSFVSRYTDRKILGVCDRDRVDETTRQIRALLETGDFDVVVPSVDFSAAILSRNKDEFSRHARIVANDWPVYQLAGDKANTMRVCMDHAIPCPKTILDAASPEDILSSSLAFPMIVKPRVGYGAIGFKRLGSPQDLEQVLASHPSAVRDCQFQEFIPQTDLQFECAMFVDAENTVKTSLVFSKNRWFPVAGGSSTLNITVDRPDIVESCSRLLRAINWRGPADIDLIQDPRDGVAKIMEINPRVSGSVKIAFVSGVDQARQMLELAFGRPVTEYKSYKIGQRLRCSQTDLLWFLKSPDRFRSKPSWFSPFHTVDQLFGWDDPLPWFAFTIQGFKRLGKEMEKRS